MNMNWGDSFAVPENMSFPGAPTHQAFEKPNFVQTFGFDTPQVPEQSFGFDAQVPDRTFGFDSQPVPDQTFGFDSQVPDQSFGFPGLGVTGQDYGKPRQDGAFSGACFRCGEVGHISRRCPRDNQHRLRGACRRCGEDGHYAKSCPMGPSEDWKGGGFGGGEGASFEIYREDVGRIIGKGGTKIRDLEKDSGARIKIARNEHPPRVLLFGSPEQCDLARRLIENLTSGNCRRGGAGDGRRANGDRGFDDSQRLDENLFR